MSNEAAQLLHQHGGDWIETIRGIYRQEIGRDATSQEVADHTAWILEAREGGWDDKKIRAYVRSGLGNVRTVTVSVANANNLAIADVNVTLDDVGRKHSGITNSDGSIAFDGVTTPLPDSHVWLTKDGYEDYDIHVQLPDGNFDIRIVGRFKSKGVTPRAPLPPFPPGSYDRELPWTPPQTRDFLRADAWGVPIAGLPFVPRGSSEHPERLLTYFLYKYAKEWQQRGLEAHAARGYTHCIVSWPDARSDGGFSIQQFVDHCGIIKQTMKYVTCFLGSKDFDPRDQTPDQWAARIDPVMDALLGAKVADEFVPAWEMDAFNSPGQPTIAYCKHVGRKAHAAGSSCWLHFFPEHTSWFADGETRGRFGFYDDLGADIDGLMYQTKAEWSIEETQARVVDTLTQFGKQRWGHKFRFYEDQASLMFTHDRPNEDDANLRGYLACCTKGLVSVYGYGNGARLPSGGPL